MGQVCPFCCIDSKPAAKDQLVNDDAGGSYGDTLKSKFMPHQTQGKGLEAYELAANIGTGSFGSVTKAKVKSTGEDRAIKSIVKEGKRTGILKREMQVMRDLDHPNVVKLYETIIDAKMIYVVMELCSGGDLFNAVTTASAFKETEAANVMLQIFRAIHYMHKKGYCHRDLKPENCMLRTDSPIAECTIKLIDFGLTCNFQAGPMLTKAGTTYYISPEVLLGNYNESCDMWSCGIIMYVLHCGYPPFNGRKKNDVVDAVKRGALKFDVRDWSNVSEDSMDLIKSLLNRNAKKRCTAAQALEHVWTREQAPKAKDISLKGTTGNNLATFANQNNFQKVVRNAIARHLNEDNIGNLKELFTSMDTDQDGTLSIEEFSKGVKELTGTVPDNLAAMVAAIDIDGDNRIEYTELLAAAMDQRHYTEESVCWSAFRLFDRDGNGTINAQELELVLKDPNLGEVMGEVAVGRVMAEHDKNGDGVIDFDEFLAMMKQPK